MRHAKVAQRKRLPVALTTHARTYAITRFPFALSAVLASMGPAGRLTVRVGQEAYLRRERDTVLSTEDNPGPRECDDAYARAFAAEAIYCPCRDCHRWRPPVPAAVADYPVVPVVCRTIADPDREADRDPQPT